MLQAPFRRHLRKLGVKSFRNNAAFGWAALMVLLLVACAKPELQQQWYQGGATQADFEKNQGQCQAQAFSVASASLLQTVSVYNSCMRGKGWEQLSAAQAPAEQIGPTVCVSSLTPGWVTCRPK